MKPALRYFELKSGYADNGPAWIGFAEFSKTGQTVYFNGLALKKSKGISGNYSDLETGDEYWVSGVKKDGNDRHWAGGGTIQIDSKAVEAYQSELGLTELDERKFKIFEPTKTDKSQFNQIENEVFDAGFNFDALRFKPFRELADEELEFLFVRFSDEEVTVKFNKARRMFKQAKADVLQEIEKRKNVLQHQPSK
jgi:hypothetical protein